MPIPETTPAPTLLHSPLRWLCHGTTLRDAGRLEGFVLRLLFALVVWRSLDGWPRYPSLPHPVGIAHWHWLWEKLGWDLTRFGDPAFMETCRAWVKTALFFYVAGIGVPVALLVVTFVHIGLRTLNNSQGAAHHGFQMVSLALLVQLAVVWVLAFIRGAHLLRRRPLPSWAAWGNWTWVWLFTIAAAAGTYVTSVVSKLEKSDGEWLKNSPCVAAQIVKTHRQNYYNHLDESFNEGVPAPPPGPDADPAHDRYRHNIPEQADWLRQHPTLARIIFGSGFFLELFAFLALLDRRAALLIGAGLIVLHTSIEWLMELTFPFNQFVVSVFFVNALGWAILMARDRAWRPGRGLLAAVLAGELIAFAAHRYCTPAHGIGPRILEILQSPGQRLADILGITGPGAYPVVILTQCILLCAGILSLLSLRPGRKNPAVPREIS